MTDEIKPSRRTKLPTKVDPKKKSTKKTIKLTQNFRWRPYDKLLIEELVDKINKVSAKKLSTIHLLRGALELARKKKPEKLLEEILEAEKKSIISKIDF